MKLVFSATCNSALRSCARGRDQARLPGSESIPDLRFMRADGEGGGL
jgi:hypothetical protein